MEGRHAVQRTRLQRALEGQGWCAVTRGCPSRSHRLVANDCLGLAARTHQPPIPLGQRHHSVALPLPCTCADPGHAVVRGTLH